MSRVYVIRHGQASFGHFNYDRLSELGARQCRLLGEYWLRRGVKLDAVYVGTLARQQASLAEVESVYRTAGQDFPTVRVMPEWNEYNMQALLTGTVPKLIAQDPVVAALLQELAPEGRPDFVNNKKALNRLLAVVMDRWVEGKLEAPGLESWPQFTARVHRALDRLREEQGSGRTVTVFTSGGVISALVQRALGAEDKAAMEIGWVIMNSSISEFRYNTERFSLVSFNTVPHLTEEELITLR